MERTRGLGQYRTFNAVLPPTFVFWAYYGFAVIFSWGDNIVLTKPTDKSSGSRLKGSAHIKNRSPALAGCGSGFGFVLSREATFNQAFLASDQYLKALLSHIMHVISLE